MPLDIRQCYRILESSEGASLNDLKQSYRHLVKVWHPDRFLNDQEMRKICEEKFKQLNEAFHLLETKLRDQPASATEKPPVERVGPLLPYRVGTKWGFMDATRKMVIPAIFQAANGFSEGRAAVCRGDSWGYIDESGMEIIEPRFSTADDFCQGRALVHFGGYGFIDRNGQWIVPPKMQKAHRYSDGFAAVKKEGKWGYIGLSGDWLIRPQFDEAQPFMGGRAFATKAGRPAVVLANGSVTFS